VRGGSRAVRETSEELNRKAHQGSTKKGIVATGQSAIQWAIAFYAAIEYIGRIPPAVRVAGAQSQELV